MTVRVKIYALVAVCAATFVVFGLWSASTLNIAKVHGPYYNRIAQDKDLIADILPPPNYIIESYLMALHMANEVDEGADVATIQACVDRCGQLKAEFDDRHAFWIKDLPEGEMKQIKTVDCYKPAIEFYNILNHEFIPACQRGDKEAVKKLARGTLRNHYEVHRESIDKVVAMATERAANDEAEVAEIVTSRVRWSIAGLVGAFGVIGGFGWYVARETVNPLRNSATRLRQLSTHDLSEVSQQLRTNAESTSNQATMASSAAEQVNANAQSLATAVDQFEASIREIAGNASNAASVARNAVAAANQTNTTITRLGESSAEIGNVIKVINSIAEQTNLLALNATIEAARAGEAGKGFAVVANEVKELAKETSKATEDIISRIGTIQSDTGEAVDAIGLVSEIITQINESQNAIAGAVEEQTAMTSEISRNISEVAVGSGEIARSFSSVAEAAKDTTYGSDQTLSTATDIEAVAAELMALVDQSVPVVTKNSGNQPTAASGSKYLLTEAQETVFTE